MQRILALIVLVTLLTGASQILAEGAARTDLARGTHVYKMFCEICHGPSGDGKGVVGVTLDPLPRDFTVGEFKFGSTDQDIFETITNGAAAKGASPLMAPWGSVLPEADRWAVIKYIHGFKKK